MDDHLNLNNLIKEDFLTNLRVDLDELIQMNNEVYDPSRISSTCMLYFKNLMQTFSILLRFFDMILFKPLRASIILLGMVCYIVLPWKWWKFCGRRLWLSKKNWSRTIHFISYSICRCSNIPSELLGMELSLYCIRVLLNPEPSHCS